MAKRYGEYWGRLFCYCLRMLGDGEEESDIQFLGDQWDNLEELQRMAGEVEDEDAMDLKVLEVSIQFIMHSDYKPRKSALVHFLGWLGYDGRTRRWREAGTYTPTPVGVQFCMRVLTLKHADCH